MPKNSKNKADQQVQKLYPDLAWMEDPVVTAQTQAAPDAATIAMGEMQKRLDTMAQQLASAQATSTALSAAPIVKARPQLSTEPDLTDLPDPLDPGYSAELVKRVETAQKNRETLAAFDNTERTDNSTKVSQLFSDFASAYPDYAKLPKPVLEGFAVEAAQAAKNRGLNPESYMFLNRTAFFKDVADGIKAGGFGAADTSGGDGDGDDGDDQRTAGVLTGSETGGKPAGGRQISAAEKQGGDMFAGIKQWQQKTGFHS